MAVPTIMTGLATLLAIVALYYGAGAIKRLPHLLSSVLGTRRVAPEQVCPKVHFGIGHDCKAGNCWHCCNSLYRHQLCVQKAGQHVVQ